MFIAFGSARVQSHETVLYSFQPTGGSRPTGTLIADDMGNLYGATIAGGNCQSCGTVYKLAPDGTKTVLYVFRGGNDGALPNGGLVADKSGNLYGTTALGGGAGCFDNLGCGTVYKLTPDGKETVLYAFQGQSDGAEPLGGLIRGSDGTLFGVTYSGGRVPDCGGYGCGVLYELSSTGVESVLYTFQGGSNGVFPSSSLIRGANGNFYGTTYEGGNMAGCSGYGCGTVYKVTADGTQTLLYSFQAGDDGLGPEGALAIDKSGNLYGTTAQGGGCALYGGCGTVFKVTPDGTETVLHAFQGGTDGVGPLTGVIQDKNGNLFGTTALGGSNGCNHHGCGTVFKITADGREIVLKAFTGRNGDKGKIPNGLYIGEDGPLFGTTVAGGIHNCGIIYSLVK